MTRKCKDDFLKANKKREEEREAYGGAMVCANLKANMALMHAVCVWPQSRSLPLRLCVDTLTLRGSGGSVFTAAGQGCSLGCACVLRQDTRCHGVLRLRATGAG